jgi:hypothetical protein
MFIEITQHTPATTLAQQAQPAQILQMRNYRPLARQDRHAQTDNALQVAPLTATKIVLTEMHTGLILAEPKKD